MSRFDLRTPTPGRRGMKASTRMSMIAGIVVFLSLVSGVSFAAWNTAVTKTATATTGAVSISTATAPSASTIASLGPVIYDATLLTLTKPITVTNTGSVAATLSSVTIARPNGTTNTLPGSTIGLRLWTGASNGTCPAPGTGTAVVSVTLADASAALNTLPASIPVGGSTTLCASTTFTGSLSAYAGQSISTELLVNATASGSTTWTASDALPAANRSFTQSVKQTPQLATPSMQCTDAQTNGNRYESTISWTRPTNAPTGVAVTYTVTFTPTSGAVKTFTRTGTSMTFDDSVTGSAGKVSVVATAPGYVNSLSPAAKSLTYTDVYWWIFYIGTDVRCG